MRVISVVLVFFLTHGLVAQTPINQVDAQGRKQGFWSKKDSEGKIIYQATFLDDKPVGESKRFHPNGKIKAILKYAEGSDISDAQLFDERGKLLAIGKYQGQMKTGEWKYLADDKVISTENYLNGKKSGNSKRYYKTGELLEESNWLNDQKNGLYRLYFQDGKTFMECTYTDGNRNGVFKTWFPNGTLELDAWYTNELKHKDWNYFSDSGELLYTLKFELGKLLNPEVQEKVDRETKSNFKNKGDSVPDPERFMQNPEEYTKLMQNR
jgi:antitoxin component YwqK of YwqJK toxin-antitoxin module